MVWKPSHLRFPKNDIRRLLCNGETLVADPLLRRRDPLGFRHHLTVSTAN
ncbi:uncharacterized protein G2W53_039568 [Senna tora]|uniref:Uncharacterized protein n=1 Tax=Senna tora TaxID=362788 RepID=A0A834STK0_9FABA|nr:uncharacterized protein G2W53_039568 [Senna tora]